MRIAISAEGPTLDSSVEPRFGRCSHVLLVDGDTLRFEVLPNPFAGESGGAGSRLASLISSRGIDVLLTGSPGPNATVALEATGIRIVGGCAGSARDALKEWLEGRS